MQLSTTKAAQLNVLKQIIEGKDTTALGLAEQKGPQVDATTEAKNTIAIIEYKLECKEKPNEDLLQKFSQVPIELLTPTILKRLKKYKSELLDAINALSDEKALSMLEQVFDETKTDKKKDDTAFGKVFWAGHPDLYEDRLGAVYKRYFELKFPGKTFEKPLQPSKASQLFGNLFGKGKERELKVTLGADKTASSESSALMQFNNL